MSSDLDWVWYSVGGLLTLTGLWLLCRSMLSDRARGRRRCPRCWYDMSGTQSLTCSECGCAAVHERRLRGTRRHWRMAIGSILLLALSYVAFRAPSLTERGWWGLAPTTALISMMPGLEAQHPNAFAELSARMDAGSLAQWQWRWLIASCAGSAAAPWTFELESTPSRIPTQPLVSSMRFSVNRKWMSGVLDGQHQVRITPMDGGGEFTVAEGGSTSLLRSIDNPSPPTIPLTIVNGQRVLHARVVVERVVGPTVAANRRLVFSLSPPPAATWTPIWESEISLPVLAVPETFAAMTPTTDDSLTAHLRAQTDFALHEDTMDLQQHFGARNALDIACPVRIELVRDGVIAEDWSDWWHIQLPAGGSRWRRLSLPREYSEEDLRASTWQVRVRVDATLAQWASSSGRFWSGEFVVPLQPELVNNRLRLRSPP